MAKKSFNPSHYASGILIPLIVVLVIPALAYFLLLPKYKEVRITQATLETKKQETAARSQQLASVKTLLSSLEKNKTRLVLIDEALPNAARIPELLANFDHLAKQSGILISSLQISAAPTLSTIGAGQAVGTVQKREALLAATENLAALGVDVTLRGKYANLKAFLANLEQNLRVLDILSLTFSAVDEDSGFQEFIIKIQTYYQKE